MTQSEKAVPSSTTIYLCTYGHSSGSEWYMIDRNLSELTPIPNLPPVTPPPTTSVALGPVIYAFGGEYNYSTPEVYYLDTRRLALGWKKAPPLNTPRKTVAAAVNSGKIYVVGGAESNKAEDWCEVFDPVLNCWKPIMGPPPDVKHPDEYSGEPQGRVIEDGEGFVVLAKQWGPFWYNSETEVWNPLRHCVGSNFHGNFVVVDEMMYFFLRKLKAYDLGEGKWFDKEIEGMGAASPAFEEYSVVAYLGDGRFCLLWTSAAVRNLPDHSIHGTIFRVSAHCDGKGETELIATVEAFRAFPHEFGTLSHCVTVSDHCAHV